MTCFSPQTDGLIKPVDALLEEVADKDPAIIPPEILALQNTRHVFQFKFAKPTSKGPPTFILQKIMDAPPLTLPPGTEGPSSAPTSPPYSHTPTYTSPPPATPSTTHATPTNIPTPSHQPAASTARKQLFITSSEEADNQQPKKQKKE